ncbi:hypothetical protein P9112_006938 [Eukaryota sp. TZLM1-RC]
MKQGVTYRRDYVNIRRAVISTYRSPPNHLNLQIEETWVNNEAFTVTPIIGIEDTPFESIRPFRPSILMNIQEEQKPLHNLQYDELFTPGKQNIPMDVLTIKFFHSTILLKESTFHQTGPGLSKQDRLALRSQLFANEFDPRQVLDLNLQFHVGYHYRTKAVEHGTLHEPPRLEFSKTQMKKVHFLSEFAL